MALLDAVRSPKDLRALSRRQLDELAAEIRTFLVTQVARTGGHLGPNLGVVELTLAIHRVFDSPRDPILFDTGHQAYVHKIVTGRQAGFAELRQPGGLSGYPSRAESEHDWIENSHASAALSWGEGMAKAFRLQGRDDTVVVVVGDGALTGGMAWEALNNISVQQDLRLVIVVNDNGRSYTPTVGGMMAQTGLTDVRTDPRYEQTLDLLKRSVTATPLVGKPAYDLLHAVKTGLKDVLAPQTMFSDLGLKYIGPIDGHDEGAVENALQRAKEYRGPVIVHCMTTKGKGFAAAEAYEEDAFHSVGKIDAVTGEPISATVHTTWTDVFGDEVVRLAAKNSRIVALTAAMLHPTGLTRMATTFPDRVFDVGIAEQHAVASAAGLATAGLHPVFAVYATFLNRAFDQVLLDVALHKLGVTFCLDRAGITGTDGASHNGMWDVSLFGLVPGLQLAAPRDATRLREALDHAVTVDNAPTVLRYSKDPVGADIPAVEHRDGFDVLFRDSARPRVLLVSYGPFAALGIDAGMRLAQQGIGVTVVDPLWALPVNPALVRLAAGHDFVITVEDNLVVGGLGMQLDLALRQAGEDVPLRPCGVPQRFLDCGVRADLLSEFGMTAQDIARVAIEGIARLEHDTSAARSRQSAER